MTKKEKFDVFISYSQPDRQWAREFADALKSRQVTVWIDEEQIVPGDSLATSLEHGLRSSEIIAIVLSANTAQRPNVLFELGAAVGMGKRVVPIVSPDLDLAAIPVALRFRRFLRRNTPDETAAQLLAESAATA